MNCVSWKRAYPPPGGKPALCKDRPLPCYFLKSILTRRPRAINRTSRRRRCANILRLLVNRPAGPSRRPFLCTQNRLRNRKRSVRLNRDSTRMCDIDIQRYELRVSEAGVSVTRGKPAFCKDRPLPCYFLKSILTRRPRTINRTSRRRRWVDIFRLLVNRPAGLSRRPFLRTQDRLRNRKRRGGSTAILTDRAMPRPVIAPYPKNRRNQSSTCSGASSFT